MSLISKRIARWNEVIGQDLVLRILHALLRQPQAMTRGLIFEGPYGVGKTTCAYLTSRALMCLGDDPLGCMQCASCVMAGENLNAHPAFIEVDAASCSGVAAARELISRIEGPAALGMRWVVLIDEAHRLSVEAWDVFLKPLETDDSSVVFLFVTTDASKIPVTIASRCASLRFGMVSRDDLTGRLMAIADSRGFRYSYEGLQAVAQHAFGRPRDAIKNLEVVAATGDVTKENADRVLNYEAEVIGQQIYANLLLDKMPEALARIEELNQRIGPTRVIQTLFTLYSKDFFASLQVARLFAPLKTMTEFFLKWVTPAQLPSEVITLFLLELSELRVFGKTEAATRPQSPAADTSNAKVPARVNPDSFRRRMMEN